MSTQYQDSRESDNHQGDVVEFPGVVGAAIDDNRDNEDEHTPRERDARFGQAHARVTGLTGAALRRDRSAHRSIRLAVRQRRYPPRLAYITGSETAARFSPRLHA